MQFSVALGLGVFKVRDFCDKQMLLCELLSQKHQTNCTLNPGAPRPDTC